ncbi:hypothetical protein EON67_05920 [archaeon]|nr:MAG: hypothetical protein EON67_05920 [archaeon]
MRPALQSEQLSASRRPARRACVTEARRTSVPGGDMLAGQPAAAPSSRADMQAHAHTRVHCTPALIGDGNLGARGRPREPAQGRCLSTALTFSLPISQPTGNVRPVEGKAEENAWLPGLA